MAHGHANPVTPLGHPFITRIVYTERNQTHTHTNEQRKLDLNQPIIEKKKNEDSAYNHNITIYNRRLHARVILTYKRILFYLKILLRVNVFNKINKLMGQIFGA